MVLINNPKELPVGEIIAIDLDELHFVGFNIFFDGKCCFTIENIVNPDENIDGRRCESIRTLLKHLGNNVFEEYYTGSQLTMNINKAYCESSFDLTYGKRVHLSKKSFEDACKKFLQNPFIFNVLDTEATDYSGSNLYTSEDFEKIKSQAIYKTEITQYINNKKQEATTTLEKQIQSYNDYLSQNAIIDSESEYINKFTNKKLFLELKNINTNK